MFEHVRAPRLPLFAAVAGLLVALILLAALQYRWVGAVGEAERTRLQAGARSRAEQLAHDFDREVTRAFAWLQVDEHQFWLVNFSNMFALGRIKTVKSCHIWVTTIETILRWAGLANDWYVEEVECGCVTGTFDCVFAIRSVET